MKPTSLIVTLVAALFSFNCGGGADPSRCTSNVQCPAGKYCDVMVGLCVAPGESGSKGGAGGGGPGGSVATNKVRAKCTTNSDCGAGGTCYQNENFSGGSCEFSCKVNGVLDPRLCPQGSRCDEKFGSCFNPCTLGSACERAEFKCQQFASTVTMCAIPIPEAANRLFVGDTCTASSQCASGTKQGVCMAQWPGGHCSGLCSGDADCGGIDTCISYKDPATQAATNFCAAFCYKPGTKSNCRTGYTCSPVTGTSQGVCLPG